MLVGLTVSAALGLSLAGCGGRAKHGATEGVRAPVSRGTPVITVGAGLTVEQRVVGEVYAHTLQSKGYRVRLATVASLRSAVRELSARQIDVYPASVGTLGAGVTERFETLGGATRAARDYAMRHGDLLLPPAQAGEQTALALKEIHAQAHGVRSIGDLRRLGRVRVGASAGFARSGLYGLVRMNYHLTGLSLHVYPTGQAYAATERELVNVVAVGTTDPQLLLLRYRLLADPRHVFGFQNLAPLVAATARRASPGLAPALEAVDRRLTTIAVRRLEGDVLIARRTPAQAAASFVRDHPEGG